jgi:hypothetical protein
MAEGKATATSDSHELRERLRDLRGRLDELRGRL